MIEGGSSDRDRRADLRLSDIPKSSTRLIAVLVEATIDYLVMQVNAGAQALKLFESWAEGLSEDVNSNGW
jgi:uroporphyrinogen decarboxylase